MTRALLAATVFLPLLGGCATDPTTGGAIFTGGMSQQEEIRVGRLHHPAILKRYGGEYGAAPSRFRSRRPPRGGRTGGQRVGGWRRTPAPCILPVEPPAAAPDGGNDGALDE